MNDDSRATTIEAASRAERRAERLRRGLVASYLHELSDRHRPLAEQGEREQEIEPSLGG